ncbi:MAG: CBS domain-containing protein, partial [Candidatus Micrarchaeia archaeon]
MEFEEAVEMDANEPVSLAMSELMKGAPCVVVKKNGEYFGIFDEMDVREVIDPSHEKLSNVCVNAPLLHENIDVRDAVKAFLNGRFKALPITTASGIKVLRRNKLLKYLYTQKLLPNVSVGEIMTVPVHTIEASESVGKAREIMRKNHIRRVVVTDNGRLAGIIAMRDLLTIYESGRTRLPFVRDRISSDKQPVRDYMVTEVITLPPTAKIADAITILHDSNASSIVVSEGDRPVGILSVKDLFEYIAAQREAKPVYYSGLDASDEEYLPEIRDTVENTVEKLKKIMRIEYVALHYKKQRYKGLRSRYEV